MHVFQQDHGFKKIVSYNNQNVSLFTTLLLICGDFETCTGRVTLFELRKCRAKICASKYMCTYVQRYITSSAFL